MKIDDRERKLISSYFNLQIQTVFFPSKPEPMIQITRMKDEGINRGFTLSHKTQLSFLRFTTAMFDIITPSNSQSSVKAVVIMLGWIGSQLKHVRKYADLYVQKDCAVVISCPPVTIIFRAESPMRIQALNAVREAARIIRKVEKNGFLSSRNIEVPVLIHYFSNGGAYVAQALDRMIKEVKSGSGTLAALTDDDISDILFVSERLYKQGYEVVDSAPAYFSTESAHNALNESVPNLAIRIIIKAFLYVVFNLEVAILLMRGKESPAETFWNRVLFSELCSRQAFIYSSSDKITDASKVDELIKERSARGFDITYSKFNDSNHVMHFRKHPDEYKAMVTNVLDKVFQKDQLRALSSDPSPREKQL